MIRAAKALLLASAALCLASGHASAQSMATSASTSQGIFTEQYFTPSSPNLYGQMYFGAGSANGTKLLVAADLSYWPQWNAAATSPAAPPRYGTNKYFSWPAQCQVDCSENVWIILNQSQSVRETTLRIEIPGWLATIGTTIPVHYATLVTDDWLAGTPTPPTPPAPRSRSIRHRIRPEGPAPGRSTSAVPAAVPAEAAPRRANPRPPAGTSTGSATVRRPRRPTARRAARPGSRAA